MRKAIKVSGGYAIKRKARVEHDCHNCGRYIEPGQEYYQLTLESPHYFCRRYYTKKICGECWIGRQLKA